MANACGFARLGILAVGLGIGAAVAHSPVAGADSSTDWLSSIDSLLSGGAVSAAPTDLNLAISFNGTSLISDGSATANSGTAGDYDLAIAYGANSSATAEGGTGDYALADGTYALANAGSLSADSGNNYDDAIDIGNNADPSTYPGAHDGAYAGAGSLIGGTDTATDSNDTAIDIGNNGVDTETGYPGDGGNTGAFAGDGELIGVSGAGNNDTAIDFGNNNGFGDGPAAVDGNDNFASESGSTDGTNEGAFAAFGNSNTVIDNANYNTDGSGVEAVGTGNYAFVDGPTDSGGSADGTGDVAYVLDPFGTQADNATAGYDGVTNGNYDLAADLFAHGNPLATDGSYVYDIITALGNETGTAAATSGSSFLTELLSLF